jgi:thiamine pyrophosphokinase
VFVVREHLELHGAPGDLLTLLPLGGAAHGVVTDGLRYPLTAETLHPGSTRGLSNELVAHTATVGVAAGVVLAVLPGPDRLRRGTAAS